MFLKCLLWPEVQLHKDVILEDFTLFLIAL